MPRRQPRADHDDDDESTAALRRSGESDLTTTALCASEALVHWTRYHGSRRHRFLSLVGSAACFLCTSKRCGYDYLCLAAAAPCLVSFAVVAHLSMVRTLDIDGPSLLARSVYRADVQYKFHFNQPNN